MDLFERIATASFHDEGHGFDAFGLDPRSLARVVDVAAPICERYFRVSSHGIERIPRIGPVIVVANHAGFLPMDGALVCFDMLRRTEPARIPRAVADYFVPRLPIVSTLFARLGVVSGTRPNVRRLLERGELLVVFPEGVSGPAKPFKDRYKIQEWRVGFAELAIRFAAPVIPVAIIGAEESWPLLAKLPLRLFGSPYLPIPATPLPLPTHVHLHYGEPLELHRGLSAADASDPEIVAAAAMRTRHALEWMIAEGLGNRDGVFR